MRPRHWTEQCRTQSPVLLLIFSTKHSITRMFTTFPCSSPLEPECQALPQCFPSSWSAAAWASHHRRRNPWRASWTVTPGPWSKERYQRSMWKTQEKDRNHICNANVLGFIFDLEFSSFVSHLEKYLWYLGVFSSSVIFSSSLVLEILLSVSSLADLSACLVAIEVIMLESNPALKRISEYDN